MEENTYESEEIYTLDLDKYGLSRLKGKDLLSLEKEDLDALLLALGGDDISLNVDIPCQPDHLFELVSSAECKQCGKCCQPNPLNPESPGIEVFKEELAAIAEFLGTPYELLEQQTMMGKWVPHPFGWTGLSSTRWLPQPCPFYNEETKKCSVHSVRPIVCKIHPVIFTGEIDSVSIKLNCEYGRELIVKAYEMVKKTNPSLEIIL